ncbi:MAG: YvcK family protein [Candidatus Woesearchaeota archaeon]|nr:YvcK family protein [Candidatus Woesearchaeota archaeon]
MLRKLFMPGLHLKRWVFLIVLGFLSLMLFFIIAYGKEILLLLARLDQQVNSFFHLSVGQYSPRIVLLLFLFFIGLISIVLGLKHLIRRFVHYVAPEKRGRIAHLIFKSSELNKGKNIVVIGGGTGLNSLLSGLKKYTNNITAIITVADEGKSSRVMRTEYGVLPPGDIRNCIVALSDAEPLMAKLLQYRFNEGTFKGHPIGNMLLTAMAKVTGSFEKGVEETAKIFAIRGRVLPVSLGTTHLCAELENGKLICEEPEVEEHKKKYKSEIKRLFLDPQVSAYGKAVEAIKSADLVVLGPGSLYTSILPNILVKGIPEALRKTRAKLAYVVNVMTQPGETDQYTAYDHVAKIEQYLGIGVLDVILINKEKAPEQLYEKYKKAGARRVKSDEQELDRLRDFGAEIVTANLMTKKDLLRHDSDKLAQAVVKLDT